MKEKFTTYLQFSNEGKNLQHIYSFQMKEKIYNIFAIFENEILISTGYVMHEIEGTDEMKIKFLQDNVHKDKEKMIVNLIPSTYKIKDKNGLQKNGISLDSYNSMLFNGTSGVIFEYIFQASNAPENPLYISTSIVNGEIKIDETRNFETIPKGPPVYGIDEQSPVYYLSAYMSDDGLDLNRLILDDFITATQIAYNHQKYVSCLKLFMSAIDSIAFLEYGEIQGTNIFQKWLDTFCDINCMNILSSELWEFRNALLHMTNPYSRKVLKNEAHPLLFYVSQNDRPELQSNVKYKYFNLRTFINVILEGIEKWTESFNNDRGKFETFLDRYDLIFSDVRYGKINFNESR